MRNSFFLLLSDAAKYLMAPGVILKSLYPKLFHVACAAHLLHNCAIKLKYFFEDVNQLIAKITSVTIKGKTKQAKLTTIDCPSQPIVTRCGRWLNAALYYAKNLL